VPDTVADNLNKYCGEFYKWLLKSPHAEKYRIGRGVCYNEGDFIDYLNMWIFPDNPSLYVETLGNIRDASDVPQKYKHCKWFNF